MNTIDIPSIESRARQLRAEEMRHVQSLLGQRLKLVVLLLAGSLLDLIEAAGEWLRPFFSWNPQAGIQSRRRRHLQTLARLNRATRALFSWNPQAHRG